MALTKETVQRMVKVVSADAVARERISSILGDVGVLGGSRGAVRNFMMVLGDMVMDTITWGTDKAGIEPISGHDFYDPNGKGWGAQLQCTGIAEAATQALNRRADEFPNVSEFQVGSRSESYPHAGVVVVTTDGNRYVVDWWMTLEVDNPMVFRHADWDAAKGGGVALKNFNGFN